MVKTEENSLKLENQICFALYSAANRMIRLYRPILKTLKLTYPQYLVMLVMWESYPVTVNGLGERLSLDSGTLTPLLKRLERLGYVSRKQSRLDKRQLMISTTKKGMSLKDKAAEIPFQIFCKSGLVESEAINLKKILEQISPNQS